MTLNEKLDYIGGEEPLYIRAIPRLGLPRIVMSDGPMGVNEYGKSTAYPATILSASTWDTLLVKRLGAAIATDSRSRGVNILLAPGINIYRAPMCGRNFEYFGEDPYLVSRLAVNYINGVQSHGVAATIKHFAANNQEYDRHNISSDIDERTLQEIYLPAFKAAVREAHVACVMDSYNLVNGVHTTQNDWLNNEILKQQWKFNGLLMSDWWATYDGVAAARGGLDLEMPSGKFMNRDTLLKALKSDRISEAMIDDKVRRILRVIFRFGFDKLKPDLAIPKDNAENAKIALQVAREGVVLLKNDGHVLPLSVANVKTLVVIGPNAGTYIAGGGSSYVSPFHTTSILDGIRKITGNRIQVKYVPALYSLQDYIDSSRYSSFGQIGIKAEYFSNPDLNGNPLVTRVEKTIDHQWGNKPDIESFPDGAFSVRWSGSIKPSNTATYRLTIRANGGARLFINGHLVYDAWDKVSASLHTIKIRLEKGIEYDLRFEYSNKSGFANCAFAWYDSQPDLQKAVDVAKESDAAIVCAGFNADLEQEGYDRTFELPKFQDSLISLIAASNPKTIVILNAGGNVNIQRWLPKVSGLLHAWYPGQEGGQAVSEILFGKTNPSGKLPVSFEKEWKDSPVYHSYYDEKHTGHVYYKEGLFLGYRYWDTAHVQPAFPFGFGLSYTSFQYKSICITRQGKNRIKVSFIIKNTGPVDGAEIAQVYVHQQSCPVERPYKELKGFAKIDLKKGESKTVTVNLATRSFSYYQVDKKRFGYDPGKFDILIGSSSKNIRLTKTVYIN